MPENLPYMTKYFFGIFLLLLSAGQFLYAQTPPDTVTVTTAPGKQISLITCGVGEELYTAFGHTAIRIKNMETGSDVVYNYGTFNFYDSLFYVKFTLGKLNYYLDKEYFGDFVENYREDGRTVKEQVLNLGEEEIRMIEKYLEHNALPQNREYRYDFVFDNCATRVRDIFQNVLAPQFNYGDIMQGRKVSFRAVINEYLAQQHWPRLGINLLLGSQIDSLMNNESALFLPDLLHGAMAKATFKKKAVVMEEQILVVGEAVPSVLNWPMISGIIILLGSLLVFNIRTLAPLKNIWSRIVLFVLGFLGLLMLFMWLGTDHQSCRNNYNILWAVPTHFIMAFLRFRYRAWVRLYAFASISLLIVAIIIHILGIQVMPLVEILPWFFIAMLVYIDMYKQSILVPEPLSPTNR